MRTVLLVLLVAFALNGVAQKKQMLFNGKDLKGWTTFVSDSTFDKAKFF